MLSALFILQKLVHRTLLVLAAIGMSVLICTAGGCSWMSSGQNSEGVRLFEQGNFDGAAQRFRQAMQTNPNNPDSYYNLAAYYHRQGKTMQRPVDLRKPKVITANASTTTQITPTLAAAWRSCSSSKTVLRKRSPCLKAGPRKTQLWPRRKSNRLDCSKNSATRKLPRNISPPHYRCPPTTPVLWPRSENCAKNRATTPKRCRTISASLATYRFQPELAQRVAALQAAGTTSPAYASASGTTVR